MYSSQHRKGPNEEKLHVRRGHEAGRRVRGLMEDMMTKITEDKKLLVVEMRKSIPADERVCFKETWNKRKTPSRQQHKGRVTGARARGKKAPNEARKRKGWIQNQWRIIGWKGTWSHQFWKYSHYFLGEMDWERVSVDARNIRRPQRDVEESGAWGSGLVEMGRSGWKAALFRK